MNKYCDRCRAEIPLTEDMPLTPRITYLSGNRGANNVMFYLCPICRKEFCEWYKSVGRNDYGTRDTL